MGYIIICIVYFISDRVYMNELSLFIKEKRRSLGVTQIELADRAGVGLRFIRDMEQGKKTLRLDKVNDVLALFGAEMTPKILGNDES